MRRGLAVGIAALALTACGGSAKHSSATTASTATAASTATPPAGVNELAAAQHPSKSQFPSSAGKTLKQLGALTSSTAQLGAANGTFTPGFRRLAFALTDSAQRFIYAPTAVYIAESPDAPVQGPFLAPADPMGVQAQFRSKQNSAPGGLQAIYSATLPVPHARTYDVLALTKTARGLIGSTGEVAVAKSWPIPDVGQRPPAIATDTAATVHGDIGLLTTRIPPESMHSVSFAQVLGKQPVLLLFSTPELCMSRICGPVTDVAVQLQHEFGNRIVFIHQEVYADNQPSHGLRQQMKAFHLETEPWAFAVNKQGIVAARLEGAFGLNELRQAIEAALK